MSALYVNKVCSGRGRDFVLFKYINLSISNLYNPLTGSKLSLLYIGTDESL